MKNSSNKNFSGFLVVIGIIILFSIFFNNSLNLEPNKRIEYDTLLSYIKNDEIDRVAILGTSLVGLKKGSTITERDFPDKKFDFETTISSSEEFVETARQLVAKKKGVTVDQISADDLPFKIQYRQQVARPWIYDYIPLFISLGLVALLWFFLLRQQGGGNNKVMSFGKSKARISDPSKNKVTFADVAGAQEEKEELQEMVDFLRNPKNYIELGARIPKGVLLVGPPGTGKTLLARAVAGEANVPFFTISGSDFVEMFVGVGASRVRDLFDQAKKNAPSIVFIDEIDAVGRHRGAGLGGGHDEREQTLNQLLVEMDGFAANEGVIVMAATNRRDILDPALLRPGRFDRQITVNYPDLQGRVDILKVHARGKKLASDIDYENIAKRTPYSTGADLENIMNEAAILTARNREKEITQQMLVDSIARVQMGPEKRSHKVNEDDRKTVAYHETGHAIVGHLLPHSDDIHLITIVPRGQAAGHTLSLPSQERDNLGRKALLDMITMTLGGHAAEHVALDDIYTGSTSDLKRATELSRRMVTEFGMSELGTIYLGNGQEVFVGMDIGHSREYSEQVAAQIDKEVKALLDSSYQRAITLLEKNIDKLHLVANALLAEETLSREEFVLLMEGKPLSKKQKPAREAVAGASDEDSKKIETDEKEEKAPLPPSDAKLSFPSDVFE